MRIFYSKKLLHIHVIIITKETLILFDLHYYEYTVCVWEGGGNLQKATPAKCESQMLKARRKRKQRVF